MSLDQYNALLDFAYGRRTSSAERRELQRVIDAANGVKRYFLYIRWMERGGSPPSRIEIGAGWPPTQSFKLRMDRPITRQDVDDVLSKQARNSVYPTVTNDELGNVGWTELDVWDFNITT
jgi:hypothetical protein